MQLIKMFNYKKRSVKDMLKGKIDIIQDFAEHDRKYADGEITYQEWSEGFSKARHPIPCCIGGSAVGTLFGHNKHKTPRELQMQISFPHDPQYQEHFSDDTKAIFARGHSAEDYVARMGAYLLEKDLVEKGLAEKVEILPYTLQCRNMAFPNCIGDFDRAVKITGGPYEGLWLGECKTAVYNGPDRASYWRDYISRTDLCAEDRVPPMYLDQMDYYLGINTFMRGAILFASCGFRNSENIQIMIERNDERSLLAMNTAQEFCEKCIAGIPVSDDVVTEPAALRKALKVTHGKMDKELPPVDLSDDPYMQQLVEVGEELRQERRSIRAAQKEMIEKQQALEAEFNKEYAPTLAKIAFLEKKRDLIKYHLAPAIGDGTVGEATVGDTHVRVKISSKPSFEKKTKAYFKKKYPEVWEDISTYEPLYTVEVKTKHIDEMEKETEESSVNVEELFG